MPLVHHPHRVCAGLLWTVLLLSACAGDLLSGQPTPFPTRAAPPTAAPTGVPSPPPTAAPVLEHAVPAGGFTIRLPRGWTVAEQGLTPLGTYYLLGPEPQNPGPDSSAVFVASAQDLAPVEAAEALQCGSGCRDALAFEETTVAGEPGQVTVIESEGGQALRWYFVEKDGRLIFLSVHDPLTLADRPDILETIRWHRIAPTPTLAPTATATPTPTPVPLTLEPVRAWRRVAPAGSGFSFEVPADWEETAAGNLWQPEPGSPFALGFNWVPLAADEPFNPALFYPEGAAIIMTEETALTWAPSAQVVLLQDGERVTSYLIIPAGDRVFTLAGSAPDEESLRNLAPVLDHVAESGQLDYIIERYVAQPVDAALGYFRAVSRDPRSSEALLYLTPSLRERLPDGRAAAPLQLPERVVRYELESESINARQYRVRAYVTLLDESEVIRDLNVIYVDDDLGWRIDDIAVVVQEETEPPPADG